MFIQLIFIAISEIKFLAFTRLNIIVVSFFFIMVIGNYPVFPTCICFKSFSSSPFDLSLQSGIATAYYLSPNHPVFNVHLLCTNLPHILLHHIQKSSPWSPSSPFSRQLHFHQLSSYIFLVSLHDMSIPPQLALPHLHSYPFYLNCTPDVLVSNLVFSHHSHSKPQRFHLFDFYLFHLFFVTATVSSLYTIVGLTTEL